MIFQNKNIDRRERAVSVNVLALPGCGVREICLIFTEDIPWRTGPANSILTLWLMVVP